MIATMQLRPRPARPPHAKPTNPPRTQHAKPTNPEPVPSPPASNTTLHTNRATKRARFTDIPTHDMKPTKKEEEEAPPQDLTDFELELWEQRNSPFFLVKHKKKEWYQDHKGLWRDKQDRLILPTTNLTKQILKTAHDSGFSGHFGAARTEHVIKQSFFWPGMTKNIEQYCQSCPICQGVKPQSHAPYGGLKPLPVPAGKWTDVTVDMITDLPVTERGYDAILVFVDRLTKMAHLVPTTKTLNSEEFCRLFTTEVIRLHGAPISLVSDRGSVFHSRYAQNWVANMGIWQKFSTAYHPQTDGQTERTNRVLEDVLRSFASSKQSEWDTYLPMAEFAMNNAPNEATKQTPFMLNYGVNPRHPEISKLVSLYHAKIITKVPHTRRLQLNAVKLQEHTFRDIPQVPAATQFSTAMHDAIAHTKLMLEAARHRMTKNTNKRRKTQVPFQVGDKVMLSTKYIKLLHEGCNKLMPRYVGPFRITAAINSVAFKLDLGDTLKVHNVFHVSLLKKFYRREGDQEVIEPLPIIINNEEEYEVEALLKRREKETASKKTKHGKRKTIKVEYLVKWKGYGPHHNQWVTEEELQRGSPLLLRQFKQKHDITT